MESYVICVTVDSSCSRHIQISADATLCRLHQAILNSVAFEDDHFHSFHLDNKLRNSQDIYVSHTSEPADRSTKQYTLQDLKLRKGKRFLYLFDNPRWIFQCQVIQSLEETVKTPAAVWGSGKAPKQYQVDWEYDIDEEPLITYPQLLTETASYVPEDTSSFPKRNLPGFPSLCTRQHTLQAFDRLGLSLDQQYEFEDYFRAAARLYGIIPLRKLLEIYNRQNPPLSEERFLQIAEILRHDFQPYSILNCEALIHHAPMESMLDWEIVAAFLCEDESWYYNTFAAEQLQMPFRLLPKKEFLKYADCSYLPKEHSIHPLREYLTHIMESQNDAENYLRCMFDLTMQNVVLEDILDICSDWGFYPETPKQLQKIEAMYQELELHTRKAIYRGHTELEIERLVKKERGSTNESGK